MKKGEILVYIGDQTDYSIEKGEKFEFISKISHDLYLVKSLKNLSLREELVPGKNLRQLSYLRQIKLNYLLKDL